MDPAKFLQGCAAVSIFACSLAAHADTWLFDFGDTVSPTPNYNNIVDFNVHTDSALINSSGQPTGLSLSVTSSFNSSPNGSGTTTPAAGLGFPASATRDSFFGSLTKPNPRMELSGLDPATLYDFTIFASRTGVTDVREGEYQLTGASAVLARLNASNNSSQVAVLNDVRPNASGKIVIDLRAGPGNTNVDRFFYINAMKVVGGGGCGDPAQDGVLEKFPAGGDYPLGHWRYQPSDYSSACTKRFPLLVWLHGSGERCPGASLDVLVTNGELNSPGYQIRQGIAQSQDRRFLDGIVIMPQSCALWDGAAVKRVVDDALAKYRIDLDRIYITGLSSGAHGTWEYAADNATTVGAIVPVAGTNAALSRIHRASHVPTWAFHNRGDRTTFLGDTAAHLDRMIPFATAYVMTDYAPGGIQPTVDRTNSVSPAGNPLLPTDWNWIDGRIPADSSSKTLLTVYPVNTHQGWKTAYGTQQMWDWLYEQRRAHAPTITISSASVTPGTAGATSGATITITATITQGSVPLSQIWIDLKRLGGGNVQLPVATPASGTYQYQYTLPASGLSTGQKVVGITAVDSQGNRTVAAPTITLN